MIGGFTDEYGVEWVSNKYYDIGIWQIFNEPDIEMSFLTPETYTILYDKIANGIRQTLQANGKDYKTQKFEGLTLAGHTSFFFFFSHFFSYSTIFCCLGFIFLFVVLL